MHGPKAAKGTGESEYSGRRKTLLPRLASSRDRRQWAFKTETILKQKELWYVIENAIPGWSGYSEHAVDNTRDAQKVVNW